MNEELPSHESTALASAQTLVAAEFEKQGGLLVREVTRIQGDMSARGVLHSGMTVTAVTDAYINELEVRALIAFNTYRGALFEVQASPSITLQHTLSARLRAVISAEAEQFQKELVNFSARIGHRGARQFDRVLPRVLDQIDAKIDLFMASLSARNKDRSQDGSVINIHGPVGAVQTGPNAIAQISYSLNDAERQSLQRALDSIDEYIKSSQPAQDIDNLAELVGDLRQEAERTSPNPLRLGSLASGVGMAIQSVAALQPAYRIIQGILLYLGISLPQW